MNEKIYKTIFDDLFSVSINMNDVFYYACSDSSEIDAMDLNDLFPLIEKYGSDAFVAYEALKRGHNPVVPRSLTPDFYKAKEEIESMIKAGNKYGPFYDLKYYHEQEALSEKEYERRVKAENQKRNWFGFFYKKR